LKRCPLCGETALATVHREFRFEPPADVPGGAIVIANAAWRYCSTCGENIIPHELDLAIDREQAGRLQALSPAK
jgi:YgiT-type zinc finger domain-containing protein